jgi:dTDP-4-amino-4,6-dideoxygalactose transaminase
MTDVISNREDQDTEIEGEVDNTFIPLSDPDITAVELAAVDRVLRSNRISAGEVAERFEQAFAGWVDRAYGIAVPSGTIGLHLVLAAYGIGPGDEVITSSFSFRETAHAITLAGAKPVFADIDYWSGTISADKILPKITDKTRAIVAGNTNGHPAPWDALRALATQHGLILIEDSTEAIGSRYKNTLVGSFGDVSIFDFSQPSPLICGEGGMIVTDNIDIASALRNRRSRRLADRASIVAASIPPYQAEMSDMAAALGLAQLSRIDAILERRRTVEQYYLKHVQSFEGIKPPYIGPDVTEVNWFLYVVHLGTRFSKSSRDAIVQDLVVEQVEAAAYASPLHLQRHYFEQGWRRGDLFVTEKVADRAVALPFHPHLADDEVEFIVQTMKDASVNVGAGASIYL